MPHRLSREQLFELVWAEPVVHVAKRLGISDVGLAKACRQANVPLPPRGYWEKKRAGRPVVTGALPSRGLGQCDYVDIGGKRWAVPLSDAELRELDIAAPPQYGVPMSVIAAEVGQKLGNVSVPRLTRPHAAVAALLSADDAKRQQLAASKYPLLEPKPLFDRPAMQRRLRLVNAVLMAAARLGYSGNAYVTDARYGQAPNELHGTLTVGDERVGFQVVPKMLRSKKDDGTRELLELTIATVRISAIVDARFGLIADAVSV